MDLPIRAYHVVGCIIWIPVLLGLSRIARTKPRLRQCALGGAILLYTAAVVMAAFLGITDPTEGWARYGKAGPWSAFMVGLPWNLPLLSLLQLAGHEVDILWDDLAFWISWCGAAINIAIVVQSLRRNSLDPIPKEA